MAKKGYKSITLSEDIADIILSQPKSLTQIMEEKLEERIFSPEKNFLLSDI